jgi:uncharacterized protein (TIGR03790 family)
MLKRCLLACLLVAGCSDDLSSSPAGSLADAAADAASDAAGDAVASTDAAADGEKAEAGAEAASDAAPDSPVPSDASDEPDAAPLAPTVSFPRTSIEPAELALLVNDDDPQSVAVAEHYRVVRGIPASNVIHLHAPVAANWPRADFLAVKAQVDAMVPAGVQAYALSWTLPYKVDCMSVVSAFALGFDEKYCNTKGGCQPTALVDYYDSNSTRPFTDHKLRPAMMLAGADEAKAKAVIDRGVLSEGTFPAGDGYFLRTTDTARSVRWSDMLATQKEWDHADGLTLTYLDNSTGAGSDVLQGKTGVLFYLTGLASVPSIETNTYLPGAVADHLTSYGGQVPTSGQMSIARWLEAGATASYGTVVEPCNYTQKFPQASKLLRHYFRGETVLEAYWKSVMTPGEGNFVGDPLARPWGSEATFQGDSLTIRTTILRPGTTYELRSAPASSGPWTVAVPNISVTQYQFKTLTLQPALAPFYKLAEAGQP